MKGVTVYGLTSTFVSEALTYFPDRVPDAAADPGRDRLEHRGMAFSLGASRWRVFRTVTLPLATPASPTRSCCCSPLRSPTSRHR
jgi:iron(III) transport system permease protein